MTTNNGPDLPFGAAAESAQSTAPAAEASTGLSSEAARARQACLYMMIGGVVATIITGILILTAGPDATIQYRRSEFGPAGLLIPCVAAVIGGLYGYFSRKAYESEGATKGFISAGLVIALVFLWMVYSLFS